MSDPFGQLVGNRPKKREIAHEQCGCRYRSRIDRSGNRMTDNSSKVVSVHLPIPVRISWTEHGGRRSLEAPPLEARHVTGDHYRLNNCRPRYPPILTLEQCAQAATMTFHSMQ